MKKELVKKIAGVALVTVIGVGAILNKEPEVVLTEKIAEVGISKEKVEEKVSLAKKENPEVEKDKDNKSEAKKTKSEPKSEKEKVEDKSKSQDVKGISKKEETKSSNDVIKESEQASKIQSKAKSEVKSEVKPQPKPEVKPQPKPQPKPEPKPQPKPQPSAAELKQREIDGWVNGLPGVLSRHYNGMVQTDRVISISPDSNAWIESGVFYYRDIHKVTQKTIYHEVGHLWDQFTELSMTPEFYAIYLDEWADSGYYGGTNAQEAVAETIAHIYLGTDAPHIPKSIEMTKQFLGLTPLSAENQKYAAMIRGEMRQWEVNASPTYNKVFNHAVNAYSDYGMTPTKGGTAGMRYREISMRRYNGIDWVVVQLSNHRTVVVKQADL